MRIKDGGHLDLNDMRLLMKVADHGGFTAASIATGVPKSTLSQRVTALEQAVGEALLRRSSRSLSLTEAGALVLRHARRIDAAAIEAEDALRGMEAATGTLRISSSVTLAQFALAPLLPRFLADHPGVSVRVEATNRYVDLIGEGYDLGLRAHAAPLKDSALTMRTVTTIPWTIAASPDYLEINGEPERPDDLARASTLHFGPIDIEPRWTLAAQGQTIEVKLSPRLCSNDMAALHIAARAGAGVVALPRYVLKADLASGALRPLLPGWEMSQAALSILTPPRGQSSRVAKLFSDYLFGALTSVIHPTEAGL
ncbi:transcriptional regulator [Caulobacter sp. AP07]|uniref:LysR family transcriptional regulator n=1 Tax=Caulobacter sp. AP07 TaxID=1144304 RepID=UPI000271E32A|nr:LysR family transcriptional regulator [Caulobacter sp. AP07]EJL38455.1 transcriptional regulator [Caulobacter sp. AP07]